jgi:hypothetical protein
VLSREKFKDSAASIAVCGVHLTGDAIHVGVAFLDEHEYKIIHFQSGDRIPLQSLDEDEFADYLFNPITFNVDLIPSLAALVELVTAQTLNPFTFNRSMVVYKGGKFEIPSGIFLYRHMAELVVNCAVFTIGLLMTYDHQLIDWDSWPDAEANRTNPYLNDWFADYNVPVDEREFYYLTAREIRGKHVIVSPSAATQPAPYSEVVPLSDELILKLTAPTTPPPPVA